MERHKDPKHNRRITAHVVEESCTRSPSTNQPEEEEEFVQETPEATLIAAQAYLLTTQPKPGDPREQMHQAAIRSLGLVEQKLKGNISEKKSTHRSERKKEMGALCFTRRVRKMRVPKGFKLPHDQEKYDGSQEPTL
jgi:hypothetical protein